MPDTQHVDEMIDATEGAGDLLRLALEQAPFAALLFRPDANLTLIWRNEAHATMSASIGREIAGRGMFEAFPPSDDADGAAAMGAIRDATARMVATGTPEEIGPYRFDLQGDDGSFVEHHWSMRMSPLSRDGEVVAILQVATDVTAAVLAEQMAESLKRTTALASSAGFFSFDPASGHFVRSPEVDAMFGFAPGEAGDDAGPFFERVHPEDVDGVHAEVARVFAAPRGEVGHFDYRVPQPDGSERFIRIRGEVATDPSDRREKLVGTFVDLTDIEQNRRQLAQEVEFRAALVQESNHRIKNSLQVALSLLRVEARGLDKAEDLTPADALATLRAVEARIRAVAGVHALMQLHGDRTTVSAGTLIRSMVEHTRESAGLSAEELVHEGEPRGAMRSEVAVAVGLVLNEMLTNALKYGLAATGGEPIRVRAAREGDDLVVSVANGMVEGERRVGEIASTRLGSRLVEQLARQVDATLESGRDGDRYRATLRLPIA